MKLRSGFLREFKSMSALFQRCQPAPEVGLGHASADEQESTNWHDLIMIQVKFTWYDMNRH
ncbi:hypothetical protein C6Y08_15175 [Lactiplantibacillus pentosus]|uniref:Uncharacterized protein n=1 Tax=Lactiplantibacillus pentosus TaxID=1589 RepID=A0ABD7IKU9_LACPE|nr:hypothetical protein C6Y08_15175 [Lactiplantibacillus pentosus]RMW42903.1 hypothetical protein D6U18_16345 [Lactiplantibacillus pentosus]